MNAPRHSVCFFFLCVLALLDSCTATPVTSRREWGALKTKQTSVDAENGDTFYLVKVNASLEAVPAHYSGALESYALAGVLPNQFMSPQSTRVFSGGGDSAPAPLTHHQAAVAFNALPPLKQSLSAPAQSAMMMNAVPFTAPAEGEHRQFWVENAAREWEQIDAKLIVSGNADGARCRVWVADDNFYDSSPGNADNTITTTQAGALACYFDGIYDKETAFFGYEKGGGPEGDGGIDGDPLVNILVYDIDGDGMFGSTVGYFWGKDEYTQSQLESNPALKTFKSNEAEIFYVDAHFTDSQQALAYATLVHEFQHMIHFNQKTLKGMTSQTWYNEMLSMLAEDMLAPEEACPAKKRIPDFTRYYNGMSVTQWLAGNNALKSYAQAYGFGAFLARNYGGAALVKRMAHNGLVNVHSVDDAVKTLSGNSVDFYAALEKFPEVILNKNPSSTDTDGVLNDGGFATFNNEVLGAGGTAGYNFESFNIYDPAEYASGVLISDIVMGQQQDMPPAAFEIYSLNAIDTGTITQERLEITVSYYSKSTVSLFVIRQNAGGDILEKIKLN